MQYRDPKKFESIQTKFIKFISDATVFGKRNLLTGKPSTLSINVKCLIFPLRYLPLGLIHPKICFDWSKLFLSQSNLHPNRRWNTILPFSCKFECDFLWVVGQFSTGQFGTRTIWHRTIWHQELKNGQFGTRTIWQRTIWHQTIWHQDNLATT